MRRSVTKYNPEVLMIGPDGLAAGVRVLDQEHGNGFSMYQADCVEALRGVADATVDYSIFSPPFASLYTYSNSDRDMGNTKDHAEFYQHFVHLIPELLRVTRPGRLLSFHCMNLPTSKARDGYIGLADFRGSLIRAFVEAGWIYHSEVCIWKDPVTAMQRTKALGLLHKQLKKDSAMSRNGIPDYLVTMRRPGENSAPVAHTATEYPVERWQRVASPIWMDIDPHDTLTREGARDNDDERHICPLQLEVIRRAVELWSNPGDLVLSPFAGIGSEGFVALQMERRFVGFELKRSYYEQACANLRGARKQLAIAF
jgi:DNA modification methylase